MSRATTRGSSSFGPKTFLAFALGVGVGLVLVAPVLPETAGDAFASLVQGEAIVIIAGVSVLALLMVLMAVFYQGYLKA